MTSTLTPFPTENILWHGMVQKLPRWSDKSLEMEQLVHDVSERGIDQPLICCRSMDGGESPSKLYLIDGRHRHRAAILANLETVPVVVREETDAAGIVLGSLIQRRHFTKGALAYLSYPVMTLAGRVKPGRPKKLSTESTIKPIDLLAVELGFSRDLFYQAKQLHELFEKREDLREDFEARILSGELGLGACIAGIAGRDATAGAKRNDRGPEQLIFASFADLTTRFSRWEKIEPAQRKAIANETANTMLALPEEVQDSVLRALKAARRA